MNSERSVATIPESQPNHALHLLASIIARLTKKASILSKKRIEWCSQRVQRTKFGPELLGSGGEEVFTLHMRNWPYVLTVRFQLYI